MSSDWPRIWAVTRFGGPGHSEVVAHGEIDANPLYPFQVDTMGRVRTKTVKKASRVLIEKYYPRLTLDFQTNKKICDEVAILQSKRLRNKIAGFTTHLMKRISRGPVRGISFKLQEEERERRDNFVPEFSALDTNVIEIDQDTKDLLKSLNFENLPGVQVAAPVAQTDVRRPRNNRGPRAPRQEVSA
ncbi:40S ribosomal protein S17 [Apophysomyces ossiformis]|uniref:40S ribosomal protein S17 n=1 Tax=Apophysomyces ossiformis TaxID=679940 RepID=A0A8H7BLY1_9FUNG|nr:40S ribosomal protein S17 [Apophysomyces ossiformis]